MSYLVHDYQTSDEYGITYVSDPLDEWDLFELENVINTVFASFDTKEDAAAYLKTLEV